jgi:hemerythrin-like metal-binding protein
VDHLTWNDKYFVGLKVLDDQHLELFANLNRLHQAMTSGLGPSVTGPLISTLMEATRRHFVREEEILAELGYPGLESHHTQHLELIRRAQSYCTRYRCRESPLSPHLLNFLRDWFAHHLQTSDHAYATWCKEHAQGQEVRVP